MIDEQRTLEIYGYTSDELKPHSNKSIVAVCDGCGRYRTPMKNDYVVLCKSCSHKGILNPMNEVKHSKESKEKMSISQQKREPQSELTKLRRSKALKWRVFSKESKEKMSIAQKNKKPASKEARHNMSKAQENKPIEVRRKISCGIQGIELKDWKGFAREKPYCDKFNESCKEHNREKYSNQCFICGKTKEENTNRALSVHHVTKNKMEGCDGSKWQLIPLCKWHHSMCHTKLWESRINYLLKHVWG